MSQQRRVVQDQRKRVDKVTAALARKKKKLVEQESGSHIPKASNLPNVYRLSLARRLMAFYEARHVRRKRSLGALPSTGN